MSDPEVKKHILSLFFLFFLLSQTVCGQQTSFGNDIFLAVKKYGQAEVSIVYPGFDAMTKLARDFSVSSCDGKKAVLSLSPLTDSLFVAAGIPYTIIPIDDAKSVYTALTAAEAMQWHSYPSVKQYDTIMHVLASAYPEHCVLDTIGMSINGKVIYALKISDNPTLDEDEPKVFLTAAIHGDELGGFVLMMRLAEKLASGASSDNLVSEINSKLEVWINPLSNPDGMYNSGDKILYPTRGNSGGYDLNRNFPDPDITYIQAHQKETYDMMSFMQQHRFALSVNFHSGAEVVNYPWDRWTRLHPDNSWFYDISRRYADTVHLHSATGYLTDLDDGITNGAAWYVVNGGRQDYATYSLGGREVTIEIDATKATPATELENLWSYNNRSLLRYISEALTGVRGHVTDSVTGLPLEAEVFIKGHDADSSQVYSDSETGSFTRLLHPGTWDITFSADGYSPFTAKNVAVSRDEITTLDVILAKTKLLPVNELKIFPNPASGEVKMLLPDRFSGNVQISVADNSGKLVADFRDTYTSGSALVHDFSRLSSGVYFLTIKSTATGDSARGKLVILP